MKLRGNFMNVLKTTCILTICVLLQSCYKNNDNYDTEVQSKHSARVVIDDVEGSNDGKF